MSEGGFYQADHVVECTADALGSCCRALGDIGNTAGVLTRAQAAALKVGAAVEAPVRMGIDSTVQFAPRRAVASQHMPIEYLLSLRVASAGLSVIHGRVWSGGARPNRFRPAGWLREVLPAPQGYQQRSTCTLKAWDNKADCCEPQLAAAESQ